MDAPTCPMCRVRPREKVPNKRTRWKAYCSPCMSEKGRLRREARNAAAGLQPPKPRKPRQRELSLEPLTQYRLRLIEMAHESALRRLQAAADSGESLDCEQPERGE